MVANGSKARKRDEIQKVTCGVKIHTGLKSTLDRSCD
jgi:hypothetical protein